jgi:hypothetical protein
MADVCRVDHSIGHLQDFLLGSALVRRWFSLMPKMDDRAGGANCYHRHDAQPDHQPLFKLVTEAL